MRSKRGVIDVSRIRQDGERSIGLFFDRLHHYESKYNFGPAQVWNLDECRFKCSESSRGSWKVALKETEKNAFHELSIDLITVFECISANGAILQPFSIYNGVHTMEP